MQIFDKVSQSANVAKWKINQQKQFFQIQNKITEIERKINTNKMMLGEQTYRTYINKGISADELEPICQSINAQYKLLEETKQELDIIRSQVPPTPDEFIYSDQFPASGNQMICPKCGKAIQARFCTDCGVEGVLVEEQH